MFDGPEHEVNQILPHGNTKTGSSYKRLLPSTRKKLKNPVVDKKKTAYRKTVFQLENSKTGKPSAFVGPLLMHQRKYWKTYSAFAHSIITTKPDYEGILACGTDGEKALNDGFRRNIRFVVFLRCFIHFEDNIARELSGRGISMEAKTQYMTDIFGKQEGTTKYTGLVDCDSVDQYDGRLNNGLKNAWEDVWITFCK